ncbi:MAG: M56 family metallopeptidase [Clostridia bacterium]|nr:M56 family metallopeptidase [Clostridia bacterium]
MYEIFKTVLILSLFGFCIIAVLLCLKPITAKKFPAGWQYYVWLVVLLSMIIPVYKLIPERQVQRLSFITQNQPVRQEVFRFDGNETEIIIPEAKEEIYNEGTKQSVTPGLHIPHADIIAYIWLAGVCIYLITIVSSYIIYIFRRRRRALALSHNPVFDRVKNELKIKRNIRIRMSPEVGSPMLVGVLFPVVYIPCREISDENMRMVFLHELTHYKRKDLAFKWLSLFVNAVHWFNPLVYLLSANISEACEISCDMAVTKNMSDEEQKSYMKTIVELVE